MLWGAIPGILKVTTGAHEVIVTIMLNYIAALFAGWTVYAGGTQGQTPGPLWDPNAGPISQTPTIFESARLPWLVGPPYRVHAGIFIALITVVVIWWLLYKMVTGFEIRTVGQNMKAAAYAGIRVNWTIVLTMMIAGGLAGLAGGVETLGINHKFAPEFGGGVGFDGITVALLGQTHPVWRAALRLPLRRTERRRLPDAVRVRRLGRHHPDHPGAGAGLCRRARR